MNRPQPEQRHGFTLMEMLVVIAIIVMLAAFIVAVARSMRGSAERKKTEQLIEKLEMAIEEYNATFGSGWTTDVVPDISDATPPTIEDYAEANRAVARIVGIVAADDFTISSGLGGGAEIVTDPDAPDDLYVVDIWYTPSEEAHDLYAHMIRFARNGLNQPELDIWSTGPDGVDDTVPGHNPEVDTALTIYGDDVTNWGPR